MVFWGGITNDTENLTRGKEKTRQNDDVNQNHNDGGDDDSVQKNSRKFQANILATMTPGAEFNRTHFFRCCLPRYVHIQCTLTFPRPLCQQGKPLKL